MNQTLTKRYEWEVTRDLHLPTVAFSHISYRQPFSLSPPAVPLHVLAIFPFFGFEGSMWCWNWQTNGCAVKCVSCPSPGQSGGSCLAEKPKSTATANWCAYSEPRESPAGSALPSGSVSHAPSPGELPHAELQWLW